MDFLPLPQSTGSYVQREWGIPVKYSYQNKTINTKVALKQQAKEAWYLCSPPGKIKNAR